MGFEQGLDLFQVAFLGRLMNLATEDGAVPGQRDQGNGNKTRN
jgi:hypothetical protein